MRSASVLDPPTSSVMVAEKKVQMRGKEQIKDRRLEMKINKKIKLKRA